MKGVIALALKELVTTKFGEDKWTGVLKNTGMPETTVFLATQDIPDETVLQVVGATCKVLGVSPQQAAELLAALEGR